jgi:acyl transferase domain-containing protein
MDPQHRLLLEAAAHLIPTPGATHHLDLAGAGVFVGISWSEYSAICKAHGAEGGPYAAQGAVLRCGKVVGGPRLLH